MKQLQLKTSYFELHDKLFWKVNLLLTNFFFPQIRDADKNGAAIKEYKLCDWDNVIFLN